MDDVDQAATPEAPARDIDADAIDLLARIDGRLTELVTYERKRETAQIWAEFREAEKHRKSAPGLMLAVIVLALVLLAVLTDDGRRAER